MNELEIVYGGRLVRAEEPRGTDIAGLSPRCLFGGLLGLVSRARSSRRVGPGPYLIAMSPSWRRALGIPEGMKLVDVLGLPWGVDDQIACSNFIGIYFTDKLCGGDYGIIDAGRIEL